MNRAKHNQPPEPRGPNPYAFYGAALFLITGVVAGGLRIEGSISPVWAYVVGINCAAAVLCLFDKGAAGKKTLRVPEAVLFASAGLGGTAGLLITMHLVRHKTKKSSFQLVLVTILLVQIVAVSRFF